MVGEGCGRMNVDALRAAGIEPRRLELGTQRLACPRCAAAKFRPRDTALALTIESDGHAVWLCHRCQWRGGTSGDAWRDSYSREQARIEGRRYQKHRAQVLEFEREKLKIERARYADKAEQAREIWRNASPASADHPYLIRKKLRPMGLRAGAKFQSLNDALLVPLRNVHGEVCNLQGIDAAGEKRFLFGAQTKGAFCCVGEWNREAPPELIAIGEGWSTTAAFITMRPAYHGVAAMSAGNLLATAEIIRDKFPKARILILADQDAPGVRAAQQAAYAIQADLMRPGFSQAGINDFADQLAREW